MSSKTAHFDISERKVLLRIGDILVLFLSLMMAEKYLAFEYLSITSASFTGWFLVLAIYFLLFGEIFVLYNLKVSSNRYTVFRSLLITSFISTLMYVLSPYITPSLPENRMQIGYFFLLIFVPVLLWRFVYIWAFFSPKYFKTIIVVGDASSAEELIDLIQVKNYHNIAAYVSNKEIERFGNFNEACTANLLTLVKENHVTEIVISTEGFSNDTIEHLNKQLILLFEEGINIKSFETYCEEVTNRVPKAYLDYNFYKQINFSKNNDNRLYHFCHRVLDILVASIGLIVFGCFLPFVLFGNLLKNRGPLFYTQERIGYQGKIFKIFKLRSMVPNAEKEGAVWAQKNDVRITSFGKFLRNTRIDEFPQFYNILKGEMSLIGPRPERPVFVHDLEEKIPFYAIRHVVRPGLTGWAQVKYPYASSLEEQETKLRYDLYYIKERNSFLDFKIFVKTISTVLFLKGQ